MTSTNKTANYHLPQWVGEDHPTFAEDFNGAFAKIDAAMFENSNTATAAKTKADGVETQIGTKTRMTCDDFDNMFITMLNKEG
jgi:hypothetical protein